MTPGVIAIVSIIGILVIVILGSSLWASRYVKVGPHEALILSGRGGQSVVIGGARFVPPVLYKMFKLDLRAQSVEVSRRDIYTQERVPINVDAVLVYKVRGEAQAVLLAAQALQGKSAEEIQEMVQSVAEGSFRDICGKMTPEEINEDRESFQNRVAEVAKGHFDRLGIDLLTFTVNHISDNQGYFQNLGMPRAADVAREARVRKAQAEREAAVVEAEQRQASEVAQNMAQASIFDAERDKDVVKARNDATVAEEQAKAEQSGPRATARSQQEVVQEQIRLAELEANRRQMQLLSEKVRPAEAERDSRVAASEGEKLSAILRAEGDAERVKLSAQADAERIRAIGTAEGEAERNKGQGEADAERARLLAEAEGTRAKLVAEAEGLSQRAQAMQQLTAATMQLEVTKELIRVLPEIVKAAATPITAVDSIKIVDFGGNGHRTDGSPSAGPMDRLLNISPATIARTDEVLRTTLGIGLTEMISLLRKGEVPPQVSAIVQRAEAEAQAPPPGQAAQQPNVE